MISATSASCLALMAVLVTPARVSDRSSDARTNSNETVHVVFRHVNLRVDPSTVLEVHRLDGELVRSDPARPPVFDDEASFVVKIDSGEIAMSTASLTALLNHHVFGYQGSPLTDLAVSIEEGRLRQKGTLHKGVPVPFSILADLSVTPDGRLKLHPTKVKAAGIPAGGLMKMFGLELDELIKLKAAPGVEIVDDDVLLSPDRLLPSPKIAGRLTAVRLEGDRIVQIFGQPAKASASPSGGAPNFIHYRGGTLRFGKLTMSDADMRLIDADPRDPFDLFPAQYVTQLVAGYSKTAPSGELDVYMPDYGEARGTNLRPCR